VLLVPFNWTEFQNYQPWQNIDILFISTYPFLSLFKTIHLMVSSITFAISVYHVIIIIIQNREAHGSRNNPNVLLTDGYYGKTRHPMYTMFIFIFTSLSLVLFSYFGMFVGLFAFLVFIILALVEEQTILLPLFKEQYVQYKKDVPRRFLRNWQIMILLCFVVFNIVGIFF
ncbi:MAG: methyltransferase family protein, partial [Candidatus Thorarchaeota archaeon]